MEEKIKDILVHAVRVAACQKGDISANDGTFAMTDKDEMIYLEDAIERAFGEYAECSNGSGDRIIEKINLLRIDVQ